MSSAPDIDPQHLYVAARHVLLNALDALADHRGAIVVVGAQAVYLRTNDADLDASVAPYTADADLAIDPAQLAVEPELATAMQKAGFVLKVKTTGGIEPGSWLASVDVDGALRQIPVDLIVPGALAVGRGRRDARLPAQGRNAARWADGLEAAVVDHSLITVESLEPGFDNRSISVRVAALLVAKCYKLHDRLQEPTSRPGRLRSKDAGDVIRLMRGPMTATAVGTRLAELSTNSAAGQSVRIGVEHLRDLFAFPAAPGIIMATAALAGALDEEEIRVLAPAFVTDVLTAYHG